MSFLRRAAALAGLLLAGAVPQAAELKLFDGSRQSVLLEGFDDQERLSVALPGGETKSLPLAEVSSIHFAGRPDYFVRSGEQRFVFVAGGHLNAAAEALRSGEILELRSRSLGRHAVPLKLLHGFTSLVSQGRASRLADDLLRDDAAGTKTAFLDTVLDRRGVPYAGVLEDFTPVRLEFEHDEQLQPVRIETFKLAGVRLADFDKQAPATAGKETGVRVGLRCRDGSYLVGKLAHLDPFHWQVRPDWDRERRIAIPASEVTRLDVLDGRTVFLSQGSPVRVEEETVAAPPQPFRKNANTHGESLEIGGFTYRSGLGVHARSSLTYRLDGRFKTFRADAGIDARLEQQGSVVFSVWGDGKKLYESPLVRGKVTGNGLEIEVAVEGVNELTLRVEPTDDLDQADVANWGGARVIR